jgi:hypothetical protein
MRLPTVLNWTLLCMNLTFLAMLGVSWFLSTGWLRVHPAARRAADSLAILNMDIYWAKGPFVLMVSKDYPQDESFAFFQVDEHGRHVALMTESTVGGDGVGSKEIMFWEGETSEVTLSYSVSYLQDRRQQDLRLSRTFDEKRSESFLDWGADGSYDRRSVRDHQAGKSYGYVFYGNDWQEIKEHVSKYHQILASGEEVIFDRDMGKWLPAPAN